MNSSRKPLYEEKAARSISVNLPSDQSEILISISDLAKMLGESVYVLRNWIRDLRPHIPIYKNDNGHNLFNEEAVQVLSIIKQLHRNNGYSMKEIEYYLVTNGKRKISVIDVSAGKNPVDSKVKDGSQSLDYQALLTEFSGEIGDAIQGVLKEVVELRREVLFLRSERSQLEDFDLEAPEAFLGDVEVDRGINEQNICSDNQEDLTLFTRQYISRQKRERSNRWYFQLWKNILSWIRSFSY